MIAATGSATASIRKVCGQDNFDHRCRLRKALAQRFAAEDATVVLLGRALTKVQTVAAELGALAMAVECDLASAARCAPLSPRLPRSICGNAVRWFRFDLFQHVPKDQPTSSRCSCATNMPIA